MFRTLQILHSINRLGSVTETEYVSCEVRTGFYIPEDTILHSHRRENLKSYKLWSEFSCLEQFQTKPL
jgi:hypothetical protein